MANRYPVRLMDHLRKRGEEEDMTADETDVVRKWHFKSTKDNGEVDENEKCPCGRNTIRYLMYIWHENTNYRTFVGSKCIRIFEVGLQNLMTVAYALMKSGVKGTFVGQTDGVEGSPPKLEFQIAANHGLVNNIRDFEEHFDHIPVDYQALHNGWICQVFPPGRESVYDYAETLVREQQYNLKLELSRYTQDDETGFSLYIIECTAIAN